MLNELRAIFKEELEPIKADINEIKTKVDKLINVTKNNCFEISNFKSVSNSAELIDKIDSIKKDLNTIELVKSKNWNDIAHLKSVK